MNIRDLPYKIAVLCYLYDADGRLLLLERAWAAARRAIGTRNGEQLT
jgi:hypothetical protein